MARPSNGNRSRVEIGVPRWLHRLPSRRPFPSTRFSSALCLSFSSLRPFSPLVSRDVSPSPFTRSTSKSYGHGTSSPGMFHSDFPKFSVRCQTIVDWIGLFTLSFFLFSLSLSLKEKVSVSFPEKFDGARFLSSSPSLLQENHRLDLVSKGNRSPTRSTRGWRIFGEGRRGEIN